MSDFAGKPLPDGMMLKPSRLKWLLIFLLSVGFVAIFVWLLLRGDVSAQDGRTQSALVFWIGAVFFGLGAMVAMPPMLGRGASLMLDRTGFACRTLFRTFRRDWRECSAFYPVRIASRQFVGFTTAQDEAAHPNIAAFNRKAVGASGMLPDTFGLSADALADLMNRFRARAMGAND